MGTRRMTLLTTITRKLVSEFPHTTLNIIQIHDSVMWG
jgi:hypothetical protein